MRYAIYRLLHIFSSISWLLNFCFISPQLKWKFCNRLLPSEMHVFKNCTTNYQHLGAHLFSTKKFLVICCQNSSTPRNFHKNAPTSNPTWGYRRQIRTEIRLKNEFTSKKWPQFRHIYYVRTAVDGNNKLHTDRE